MTDVSPGPVRVSLAGLVAGGGSGVTRYATALSRALDEVAPEFPTLELTLLTTAVGAEAVDARHLRVRDFRLRWRGVDRGPLRVPLEQVLVLAGRGDLLHFFDLSGPVLGLRRPFVTTIHDAGVVYGIRKFRHAYKRPLWPWALRRSVAVVAVSQFTKDEALRHFHVPAEKITVIHSGPGLAGSGANGAAAAGTGAPSGPYLLYVGDLALKKNVGFLVRAFGKADVDERLLLVGRPGDGAAQLVEEIERSPKRERIELLTGASDEDLEPLYRNATALLHPARYEGFGFTPLEAMARGCPVVASDIPAIQEISGAASLLVSPDDEPGWAAAIRRVSADEGLRHDLRERGERVVSSYSWTKTARRLSELFLRVGAGARA